MTLLRPAPAGPSVVACSTCRHSAEAQTDETGRRGGARLAEALREVRAADPRYASIAIEEMACLFACAQHCTVHLRAPGKMGYVLGRFRPDVEAARSILDYALAHAESEEGSVPYRQWPEGVKGHFIVRVPPEGFVVQ
ncbi:putative metal-binding protein [Sphingomonas oligoaromativorans]|nr:putative metal-binding protein [Sphingomonas oligoaromativorans]